MQTYISVWRKEAHTQTGQTTQAKADTRELGLLSILWQILQTLVQLVTVVVIALVTFQMMVRRPYIRWPRFKIWTLWQQYTSALTRLGKWLLWKKMDWLHNWLHNDEWLQMTMSNSGSYPVTPVASQLCSSTPVAHHLLRSHSRWYLSVKYIPWSMLHLLVTTPRCLPCLDMSSLWTRYILYLVAFSPDLT